MKKKLLIFHPTIAPYRIDYFNALNEAFDMKMVLWNTGNINQNFTMENLYAQLNYKPIMRTERYGVLGLKLRKGMISEMRAFNPDTILSCECGPVTIMALFYKLLFNRKCKVVTMIDDSFDMISGGRQVKKIHALAERIVLPFINDIICVDPQVTRWMNNRFGKGITMPIISNENHVIEKYRELLPLSTSLIYKYNLSGKKVVLYVGRLEPEKNVETLIKAFCRIQRKDTTLVIVGSGSKYDEVRQLAIGKKNIIFTGRLEGDNVYAWYNIANVFVLPSLLEPFGAVTAEALYGGCYCLVSRKAGSQFLIHNNKNGLIIDPDDIEDISAKIQLAIKLSTGIQLPLKKRTSLLVDNFTIYFENVCTHI